MISAFGPSAERFAAGLSGTLDAIVIEPARLLDGYVEAVRRRSAGESFYGMLLLEENRDRTMSFLATAVLREKEGEDNRRNILASVNVGGVTVNGKMGRELLAEPDLEDEQMRRAAAEFFLLCPALLVRSMAEFRRISELWARLRPFEVVLVEPELPPVERRVPERPGLVIWAPERDAAAATLHAFALSEVHGDVTLVSSDGIVPAGSNATAYRIGDSRIAEALATATCIVIANGTDPGAAVAFARRGYGVVAPISSGAHEFVRNLQPYDPAIPRQIHVSAMMALGQPASPRSLPPAPPRTPLRPGLPVPATEAPPATIVVPTFNRRDDLERCLTAIGTQTYPNMHAVVVNDAGERVDDVVARFPFARLVHLEKNGGVIEACMGGLELVEDGFVQFLADDDSIYPDHVERLVTAMLLSGADIAHANTLIRYVERVAGAIVTTGFNAAVFLDTATPSEALITTPIAGHSLMWRRSVFREIGGWRPDSTLADQEVQMRAGKRYAFIYVDQMTVEWRIHGENFSSKANVEEEQRRIFEVLHPTPDRPFISMRRNQVLENIAARPPGSVFGPTVHLARATPKSPEHVVTE
jgi:glycosyltransferase involved in cell wall biosynthesis